MKRLFHRSKGFTLIELMVVMTIMSIMAAIVVPAVTGTTTVGRGTTMTADINTVQNAVERFVGDHPKGYEGGWPTYNGKMPGAQLTPVASLPLDWTASFVDKADGVSVRVFGTTKTGNPLVTTSDSTANKAIFGSTYLRTALQHAGAFVTYTTAPASPPAASASPAPATFQSG